MYIKFIVYYSNEFRSYRIYRWFIKKAWFILIKFYTIINFVVIELMVIKFYIKNINWD